MRDGDDNTTILENDDHLLWSAAAELIFRDEIKSNACLAPPMWDVPAFFEPLLEMDSFADDSTAAMMTPDLTASPRSTHTLGSTKTAVAYAKSKTTTVKRKMTRCSTKREKIPRIEPTSRERAEATTFRSKKDMETWYGRLNDLARYKEAHGHTNVSQQCLEYRRLGIWVNKQRMHKKFMDDGEQSSMTQDRVKALERLGFVWAKRRGDFAWNARFEELQEYKLLFGHVDVPTKYAHNKALGRWVSTQRAQTKLFLQGEPSRMTQERYEKLKQAGFNFDKTYKQSHA